MMNKVEAKAVFHNILNIKSKTKLLANKESNLLLVWSAALLGLWAMGCARVALAELEVGL